MVRRFSMPRLLILLALPLVTLLAGCGVSSVVRRGGPTPTLAPTATTIPPTPAATFTPAPAAGLIWQQRTMPAPFSSAYGGATLAVSPVDNALAWVCAPQGAQGSSAQVWITHDQAATWQPVATIKIGGPMSRCSITPDDLDPATAVLQAYIATGDCCDDVPYPMHITRDGGQSWAPLSAPDKTNDTVRQIASFRGNLYAIFARHLIDLASFESAFVVSTDGARTWKSMDSKLTAPNTLPTYSGYVWQFWINPASGAMLAHTETNTVWQDHFLASSNGGDWHDLHAPQADDFYVRTPFAAGPWEICGLRRANSSDHPTWNNTMPCTLDGGASWQTRTITPMRGAFAIANDGSVLGFDGSRLMRLTPGGDDWQSLGPLNTDFMPPNAYVAGSGSGVIWNVPGWYQPTNSTAIYVARYA